MAQPWGGVVTKTESEGSGRGGQGAGKPAARGCPSVALRVFPAEDLRENKKPFEGSRLCLLVNNIKNEDQIFNLV